MGVVLTVAPDQPHCHEPGQPVVADPAEEIADAVAQVHQVGVARLHFRDEEYRREVADLRQGNGAVSHSDAFSHADVRVPASARPRATTLTSQLWPPCSPATSACTLTSRIPIWVPNDRSWGATKGPFFMGYRREPFASSMSLVGSATLPFYTGRPSRSGEQNEDVLIELDHTPDDVVRMVEAGALVVSEHQPAPPR